MRKKIVAGNWKMNTDRSTARYLALEILKDIEITTCQVILIPPFPFLTSVEDVISDQANYFLGAQDVSTHENGAYTGEVSAGMLHSVGVDYVLVGHSERRIYHHESDDILLEKVHQCLDHGLIPIFCCGEPLEVREVEGHANYVINQLKSTIFRLEPTIFQKIIIAYEPIWAIGTGKTATSEQAQDMHGLIRKAIAEQFNQEISSTISILYGGSVNEKNADELFSQVDVDGALVGGASLKEVSFRLIVNAMNKTVTQ